MVTVRLSNYGVRFLSETLNRVPKSEIDANREYSFLLNVLKERALTCEPKDVCQKLLDEGMLETIEQESIDGIVFKYRTNPLENVNEIVFELTTQCNFNCIHCRNGQTIKYTETNIEKLKHAANVFLKLHIENYSFIGGEVSKFGNGWLELTKHISTNGGKKISLFTNGWWLEAQNFEAAGKTYLNDIEYLKDLKKHGLTHTLFSIDGKPEYHDKSRRHKGLFERILNAFERIKNSGIEPRISGLFFAEPDLETYKAYGLLAEKLYELPKTELLENKIHRLINDPNNLFSNYIDIGNGVALKQHANKVSDINPEILRCKAFYRPAPNLRIMANGNLSVCPLLHSGEGFGSLENNNLVYLLNTMQNAFAYKLHAENRIAHYLPFYDTSVFGKTFDHICSVRAVLTLIAKEMNNEPVLNAKIIKEINLRVAKISGHSISK